SSEAKEAEGSHPGCHPEEERRGIHSGLSSRGGTTRDLSVGPRSLAALGMTHQSTRCLAALGMTTHTVTRWPYGQRPSTPYATTSACWVSWSAGCCASRVAHHCSPLSSTSAPARSICGSARDPLNRCWGGPKRNRPGVCCSWCARSASTFT